MHPSRARFIRSMCEKASRPLDARVQRQIERECKRIKTEAGLGDLDLVNDRVAMRITPQLGKCIYTGELSEHPVRPPSDFEAHSATFCLDVRLFQIDMRVDVRKELAEKLRQIANDLLTAAGHIDGGKKKSAKKSEVAA